MSKQTVFEIPTASQIAKVWALSNEIQELNYRKIRPFVVAGTGALSDLFFQQLNSEDSIFYTIKYALANTSLDILLDKESLAIVRKVQSGHFTSQDQMRYQQLYDTELQDAMWIFQLMLITCVQVPMLGILYYLNKNVAKKAINYINFKGNLTEQTIKEVRLSASEIKILIKKLENTRNSLRNVSYVVSTYSIGIFLTLMLLGCINYNFSLILSESRYFPWLTLFAIYTAIESYWIKRSLRYIEKDYTTFLQQLTEITKGWGLKWIAEKGSYLNSSYFTLDLANKISLNHEDGLLSKEIFLKVIKRLLLNYACTLICFNSNRGIILTRDKPFKASEMHNLKAEVTAALKQGCTEYKKAQLLLTQLNKISTQFACRQTWDYYPEEEYFAINLHSANKETIIQIENKLVNIYGKQGISFDKSSRYLIAKNILAAEDAVFKRTESQTNHTSPTSIPLGQYSSDEQITSVTTKKIRKNKLKKEDALTGDIQPKITIPSKNEVKIKDGLYSVYSPNIPVNTHYARYCVPNKDIMMTEIGNKTLYTKFFEIIKNGQMGGKGNHIARLRTPKQVKGYFGNTIFATHKLIIPALDMRIYGTASKEEDKTVLDFDTVVPKHKWSSRTI